MEEFDASELSEWRSRFVLFELQAICREPGVGGEGIQWQRVELSNCFRVEVSDGLEDNLCVTGWLKHFVRHYLCFKRIVQVVPLHPCHLCCLTGFGLCFICWRTVSFGQHSSKGSWNSE